MEEISVEEALKKMPSLDRAAIDAVLALKKLGVTCEDCENAIWVLGSVIVGRNTCFTCITGEADDSEDYEIGG